MRQVNIIGNRNWFFLASAIVILPGLISLGVFGLKPGIDFTGGVRLDVQFQNTRVTPSQAAAAIKGLNYGDVTVHTENETGNTGPTMLITFAKPITSTATIANNIVAAVTGSSGNLGSTVKDLSGEFRDSANVATAASANSTAVLTASLLALQFTDVTLKAQSLIPQIQKVLTTAKITDGTVVAFPNPAAIVVETTGGPNQTQDKVVVAIETALVKQFGAFHELFRDQVSGSIAANTIQYAILAVVAAALVILVYITIAFRKVQNAFRFGACAIAALLHDVLVVVGVFSILGVLFQIQVDSLFVTALLTVIGFSVHDTIVVFDRIRENLRRHTGEPFGTVVNGSIVQTLVRSLNTSLTVLFTLGALYLFGGVSIQLFTLALLVGIFSGTYSSIFNASCLLVVWDNWANRNQPAAKARTAAAGA